VLNFWGYDETDKIVDLHNRRIKSIDTTTFCNFANLVELNLSNNQLKTCEPGLFDGLVSLKHLGLL
jgi:Leucine-rich repeat (LRR) protein